MTRLLTIILLIAAISPVQASGIFDRVNQQQDEFLHVDEAFIPSISITPDGSILAQWHIAPGYYLYKHRLAFELGSDDPSADISLGEFELPDGQAKVDEYFGEIEAYYESLDVRIPLITGDNAPASAQLIVSYQGCADKGLCYPPATKRLPLDLSALVTGAGTADAEPSRVAEQSAAPPSEQDRLLNVIKDGSLLWIALVFAGTGFLLGFTACVLPMLPILSSLIVGQGKDISAWRGFSLSLVYVLGMAGTLTLLGIFAASAGGGLAAYTQTAPVIGFFAGVLALLALSMFGLYDLRLPSALQTRLSSVGSNRAGSYVGAALMGLASTTIVSACAFPAIVAALLAIGSSGDMMLGATAMFSLGMGLGLPLILIGSFGGAILPKAGPWMDQIKQFFGVVLLAAAIWLLARIIPGSVALLLYAALFIGYGYVLGALSRLPENAGTADRLRQGLGLLCLLYGAILFVGGMRGADDPLRPLTTHAHQDTKATQHFERIKTVEDLELAINRSVEQGKPLILDFYADWCIACIHMERDVFPATEVQQLFASFNLIQADVTANDSEDARLMKALGVKGPPTLIFYDTTGKESSRHRIVGEMDKTGFAQHLRDFLRSADL